MLELLTVGSGLCRTSRIKIYWSISKTTDHSHHFDIFSFLSSGSKIPFFLMWKSSTKLTERYFCFFLFPPNLVCIYPHMPPGTCIFLFGQAGVSLTVLISLSWSDDCFPLKYSELHLFPFWHTLDHVILDPQNEILKTLPSCILHCIFF